MLDMDAGSRLLVLADIRVVVERTETGGRPQIAHTGLKRRDDLGGRPQPELRAGVLHRFGIHLMPFRRNVRPERGLENGFGGVLCAHRKEGSKGIARHQAILRVGHNLLTLS